MAWRSKRCSPGWDGRHEEWAVKLLVVLTTEANQAKAEALAAQLLEQRLAACIALQPQQSLYHWQGRIERDNEVQLVIKTNAERLEALEIALHQLHSYDVPEWIVLSGQCSEAYGSWLSSSLKPPQPGPGDAAAPGL